MAERASDGVSAAINRARAAYLRACALDIAVRKPGNVSLTSPGHGMQAQQFIDSAQASAPALFARGARVGERIEAAIEATGSAVGCNTNLGIVLLCAPVALAVEHCPQARTTAALCDAIDAVLAALSVADAQATFRAIAKANPGGLGSAPREDVHHTPTTDLRTAMALAADRDTIAHLYRDGYAALFASGVAALGRDLQDDAPAPTLDSHPDGTPADATTHAVLRCYLTLLAGTPDTHIVRKHGLSAAHAVMTDAARWRTDPRLHAADGRLDTDPDFIAWDASLKAAGLNPGTTADLTVAALLLALIEQG